MSKYALFGSIAATVAVLDQLTKWYVRATMPPYTSIAVIDSLLNIVHVSNPGGAFSLFAGMDGSWRRPFFVIVPVIAMGVLLYMLREINERQRLLTAALGGILGGALGNFLDRARLGAVTDFVDVYWGDWHWPAFNVADSFISVGIVVLMYYSLFGEEPGREPEETAKGANET